MASKPSGFAKAYKPKSKLVVSFDENSRKDFVTGFRKRKNERRMKARNEQKEALRQEKITMRKEERKGIEEKIEARMKKIDAFGLEQSEDEEERELKKQYKPKHDILITTTISPLLYDDHLKPLVFKRRKQLDDEDEVSEKEKEREGEQSSSESEKETRKRKNNKNNHNNKKQKKQNDALSFPTIEYEITKEETLKPEKKKGDEKDRKNDKNKHKHTHKHKKGGYSLLDSVEKMKFDEEGHKIVEKFIKPKKKFQKKRGKVGKKNAGIKGKK